MTLQRIKVYDAEKGLIENPEGSKKYVISNIFGVPLRITESGFKAGMLAQSEGEDLINPQNAHYRLIESDEELFRLQNLATHLYFRKQKMLDTHKRKK